ncbi:hypothetical protein [Fimbriiglobus ruber]|uniref:Transmembrane protein n=1 Tax=Fimbriiglobus ruber TaxID=1908690 RepID=A0A225E2X0_9BACT|nr:hypothetical protein [Fimbriiglobus ruber]OWK45138.1 hypothetical protein FRUB_01469 [Fimbriiglobus ruber]
MSDAPTPPPVDAIAEAPKSWFEKAGAALPIALTALATAFAGMSSSEMSRAMYWRSAAAQDQSKANDQWSLAGFKRDRALIVQTAAAQLHAAAGYRPWKPAVSPGANPGARANGWREWERKAAEAPVDDEAVRKVLDAVRDHKPEADAVALARKVSRHKLDAIVGANDSEIDRMDDEWRPLSAEADKATQAAVVAAGRADDAGRAKAADEARGAQAARYEIDAGRYRAEAVLNRSAGFLYEVCVKISVGNSDRHRTRSENFFYAMLAAQVGATIASLGLARNRQSTLWLLASAVGLVSVGFGIYVYLGI